MSMSGSLTPIPVREDVDERIGERELLARVHHHVFAPQDVLARGDDADEIAGVGREQAAALRHRVDGDVAARDARRAVIARRRTARQARATDCR